MLALYKKVMSPAIMRIMILWLTPGVGFDIGTRGWLSKQLERNLLRLSCDPSLVEIVHIMKVNDLPLILVFQVYIIYASSQLVLLYVMPNRINCLYMQ